VRVVGCARCWGELILAPGCAHPLFRLSQILFHTTFDLRVIHYDRHVTALHSL
jgi:hypothetical protein